MAIVKGQWYQWKIYPDHFYRVSVVSSYVQLYPYDTTSYQVMTVSQAYVQEHFRLLASAPQNFLLGGKSTGISDITRAFILNGKIIRGSGSGQASVSQSHALLDTTLRGRVRQLLRVTKARAFLTAIQIHGSVQSESFVIGNFTPKPTLAGHVNSLSNTKGSDFTVYPLGGYLAAHGAVVQAQAN